LDLWNGEVVNGNTNNTLFINPVESQDFGTYTINYTDASGCEAVYYFSVVEDNSLCDGGSKIVDQNSGGFKLYPNPVSDKDVVFVSGVGIKHVEVFDVMGRQLNTQNFNTDESLVEINCSGFESGIYFARINGQYISKFIVQR